MPRFRPKLCFDQLALIIAITNPSALLADTSVSEQYSLPPQPLENALKTYGLQTGLQLFYPSELVAGKTSHAVTEQYSPQQALNQLLLGTGIDSRFEGSNIVVLQHPYMQVSENTPQRTPDASSSQQGATTLPAVNVVDKPVYDSTDPYNEDYVIPDANAGTKTDSPTITTPFNVQVVAKQVLKDQQVISLDQALKNVSGAVVSGGGSASNGQSFSDFVLRGFQTDTLFRNGTRLEGFGAGNNSSSLQFANIERLEVLKGPAAILYGAVEPGGIVNVVTKQPLATPYHAIQQQFGSFDLYRTSIDTTGPINDNLLYRLNLSYSDQNSFVDRIYNQNYFLAPVLKWNISQATQVTVEFQYSNQNFGQNFGIFPLINGQLINNSRNTNYADRSPEHQETYLAGLNWSHQFNENWLIRQQFLFNRFDIDAAGIQPSAVVQGAPAPSGTGLQLTQARNLSTNDLYSTNLDLIGHFNTGVLKHALLLGGDFVRFKNNGATLQAGQFDSNFSLIDLFNPTHPGKPFPGPATPFLTLANTATTAGVYLQDQVALPWNFYLLAGGRYQHIEQSNFLSIPDFDFLSSSEVNAEAITPRVGLLWQARDWLSLYGNYTENLSFNNTGAVTRDGNSTPPSFANQWEVGIKTTAFNGKLTSSFDYFNITKTNIPVADPLFPQFQALIGAANSSGFEFDIQGEVTPGLNIIANYAHINARVTQDSPFNPNNVGAPLDEIPTDVGRLWAAYEFQKTVLKGVKIGGGATFNGPEPLLFSQNSPLRIPGYITVDLFTGYSFNLGAKKLTFQLNATNILDKTFIINSELPTTDNPPFGFQRALIYGTPRSFIGSVKLEF